ncbi:hypothetical protein Y032_0595g432 [Ancylostoma ceylanicum]|nr:hypothetical protein Y032_0595g432 [Ancylostoma ceylanicum]
MHLITLLSIIAAALACAPGTGNQLGVLAVYFEHAYNEHNRAYLERYVRNALYNIVTRQYHRQYDGNLVRVSGRNVDGKVVVDIHAMNINCGYLNDFMAKFRGYIQNRFVETICPAN